VELAQQQQEWVPLQKLLQELQKRQEKSRKKGGQKVIRNSQGNLDDFGVE
jgi:hypothetical protein